MATTTTLREKEHWAVTVERNGENVVTIESNCLSGRDLSAEDERVIETAATHLLSFIGKPALAEAAPSGWFAATLNDLIAKVQASAEALRIVDYDAHRQKFLCRACKADEHQIHAENCPWVHYVRAFKALLDFTKQEAK